MFGPYKSGYCGSSEKERCNWNVQSTFSLKILWNTLLLYKKAPCEARTSYCSSLIEKKKIATLDFSSAQYSFQYHWSLFRLFFSNLSNYYFSNSKTSTCVLDHIPTRLLNEVLPSYNLSLLNMPISINDLGTTDFQLAVIKPLLKSHRFTHLS